MMNRILSMAVLMLALGSTGVMAQTLKEKTPAFPGAEGYGRYVTGGRGGKVYHVTNLNDSGTGSLRWACEQSGTRTIVFDVCGTIHLKSQLKLRNGNVTIAGQTAPGDGICLADWDFSVAAPNVIIRYMRFRCSDTSGGEPDGFGGFDSSRVIVDHCTVSWSVDECLSLYGNEHMTVQWCLVSQSLRHSTHDKGNHGYGAIWGGKGASYHHNLLVHHDSRTPRFGNRPKYVQQDTTDYRCNVIYNWAGNGCYGGEGMKINMVNNYYKPGPATDKRGINYRKRICGLGVSTKETDGSYHIWGKYFVDGNLNTDYPVVSNDNWAQGIYNQISSSSWGYTQATKDSMKLAEPLPFIRVTTHTAEQTYDRVLRYAGCSISRDWIDTLMVHDVRYRTATYTGSGSGDGPGIIDTPYDMMPEGMDSTTWSPWPELKKTRSYVDSDGDGMDDNWEDMHGLDPTNSNDGATVNDDGYTNLEHYINSLVANITEAQNEGGTEEGYVEYEETNIVTIPQENIDLNKGTITMNTSGKKKATIKDGKADSFSNNDHLTFQLLNNTEAVYTVSFGAATTRSDFKLNMKLTDSKTGNVEADTTLTIANTGAWQTYQNYSFDTSKLLTGEKKLDMTFLSSGGNYTGNMQNLSITLKESTGINSISTNADARQPVYDLQGRHVNTSHLRPGIYIFGQRKIVIK